MLQTADGVGEAYPSHQAVQYCCCEWACSQNCHWAGNGKTMTEAWLYTIILEHFSHLPRHLFFKYTAQSSCLKAAVRHQRMQVQCRSFGCCSYSGLCQQAIATQATAAS